MNILPTLWEWVGGSGMTACPFLNIMEYFIECLIENDADERTG